jgi:pimeloyl-ACP methyl ester carboxylesterase
VDLFVRESGPAEAPTIVFLHGGRMSGWSWGPVVDRMPEYRCLIPDLPQFGNSVHLGALEIGSATDAVAELIRSRVATRRVHLVGFSLGAQVGVQLLATKPELVDRAVLSGTMVNALPWVRLTQRLAGLLARPSWTRRLITRRLDSNSAVPAARIDEYREDVRLILRRQFVGIVMASAGFTVPEGLDRSDSPTLFLTGTEEMPFVRRSAAALAHRMPNGVDRVAKGMGHAWPLCHPELFARTVDAWFTAAALPPEIAVP